MRPEKIAAAHDLAVVWQDVHISPEDRAALLGQRPVTVWLTGLSGAGKSTLAIALERHLISTHDRWLILKRRKQPSYGFQVD